MCFTVGLQKGLGLTPGHNQLLYSFREHTSGLVVRTPTADDIIAKRYCFVATEWAFEYQVYLDIPASQ